LLGSNVAAVVDGDVRAAAKELERALATGRREEATLEAELEPKGGASFPAEATFSLLETDDGYERVAVVRDVTARKRREEALEEQRDRVERLNRLGLRVFDAIRGAMRAETRERIHRAVCARLTDGDAYRNAAIGSRRWLAGDVTTSTGEPWRTEGWREAVPPLVDAATAEAADADADAAGVVTDGDTAAVPLRYDDRTFGVLVLRSARTGFDETERALLTELGTAVGLAVSALERKDVLVNDSVATLAFTSAALARPFTEELGSDASFEFVVDRIVPVSDDTYVTNYSVAGIEPSRFAAAADAVDAVESTRVVDSDERRVQVRTTETGLVPQFRRFDGQMRSASVGGGSLSLRVDVPVTNVREAVDAVTETYPDLDLVAQRTTTRPTQTPTAFRSVVDGRLTERQSSALELACFSGYFDWPRTTQGTDLAETMGITPPTFHKHLRVAQRRVFDALYETPREG
jgi:GAF domain-containing protein